MNSREELRQALHKNDEALKDVENQVVGSAIGITTFCFLNALFSFRYPGWAQAVCIFMAVILSVAMWIQCNDFHRLRLRRMDLQQQYREYKS